MHFVDESPSSKFRHHLSVCPFVRLLAEPDQTNLTKPKVIALGFFAEFSRRKT